MVTGLLVLLAFLTVVCWALRRASRWSRSGRSASATGAWASTAGWSGGWGDFGGGGSDCGGGGC